MGQILPLESFRILSDQALKLRIRIHNSSLPFRSVRDPVPHPDQEDPYVFGPPGSASGSTVSHKYGSVSFPFLIKTVVWTEIMVTKSNFGTKFSC